MLKKLLKYDLSFIFKFLVIFYILSLLFAFLTRIFFTFENSFLLNIIAQICSGVTISMMFNILINNSMRLWVRFKQNFYSDESYLTHTLPISKKTLYLSKFLTSIITLFTSIFVIFLTIFIAYFSKEFLDTIKDLLSLFTTSYNTIIKLLFSVVIVFFLEIVNILQCGYTGIILGQRKNDFKIIFSLFYGFITFLITQLFVLLIIFISSSFNSDILNLIFTNELISIDSIKIIIYLSILMYTLSIISVYFVNKKIFTKGVNVE